MSQNEQQVVAQAIKAKTWFAFDLDDIKHEFRKASNAATSTTLGLISKTHGTSSADLKPKDGALELIKTLKFMGKKIAFITEGPQDAQERTVKALSLAPFVDFLATTNFFRVSKIEGLYAKVLDHLNVRAEDMVLIGDNEQRDIVPAINEGIFAIHYAESDHVALDARLLKLNSLKTLDVILSDESVR